nr:MAG TPA: hypothetical protein [Caudoviricetes sp.]
MGWFDPVRQLPSRPWIYLQCLQVPAGLDPHIHELA